MMLKIGLFCLLPMYLFALSFELDGELYGVADNLENMYGPAKSQTIFGTQSYLNLGVRFNENHTLLALLYYFQEFGAKNSSAYVQPLLTYRYLSDTQKFLFGSFDRSSEVQFHEFLLSRIYEYRHPVMAGVYYLRTPSPYIHYTVWLDWTSRQTKIDFEEFLLGSEFFFNHSTGFFTGWNFIYNHLAGREPSDSVHDPVKDVGALMLCAGYRYYGDARVQQIEGVVRGLLSFDRDRGVTNEYSTPAGIEAHVAVDFSRFSVGYTHYHLLYNDGSYLLESRERQYDAPFFDQFDFTAHILRDPFVTIDFSLSLIFVNGGMNNRQIFTVSFPINTIFGKKKDEL